MHEREEGWGLTEDGSGGGDGGSGGEGGRGVSGDGEGGSGGEGGRGVCGDGEGGRGVSGDDEGGSCGEEGSSGVDGGSGGVDEAARLRGVGGGSGWRRRRTALVASTSAGDGGEVGRRQIGETTSGWVEGFGGEVVAGGKRFFG